MKNQKAFTIIELVATIALLAVIGVLVWSQLQQIDMAARDDKRRTAINAMYYNLEEVYFKQNKNYPRSIDEKVLTAMDKELFTDPNGKKLGDGASSYRYEPLDCSTKGCKGYTLRTTLEAEADYVKENR